MSVDIDFLERVQSVEPSVEEVAVHWEEMTIDHAKNWQKNIQPTIDLDDGRADRKWRWLHFLTALKTFYVLRMRRPKFLTALVKLPNGDAVPVGMLMMLVDYPRIDGNSGGSVFTLFVASAPKSLLQEKGVANCPNLGRALIDSGIVTSYQAGKSGHTWLHCTPLGGDRLFGFYKEKCKLHRLSEKKQLPVKNLVVKANDGRHFFTDPALARRLTTELDKFRPQPVKTR